METKQQQAREIRLAERARYLEINSSTYPDAEERWKKYEKLIYDRYTTLVNSRRGLRYEQALDIAWIARDKRHSENVGQSKQTRSGPQEADTFKAHSGRTNENR